MLDKLKAAKLHYEEIRESLSDPTVITDQNRYKKLMREFKSMTPLMDELDVYEKASNAHDEAVELASMESDPDFKEMLVEEIQSNKRLMSESFERLRILLLPKYPNDDKNIIIEIRAGAGGEEAALFAADIFRMYSMYAASCGFKCEVNYENETELGGYKEISFTVLGEGAYSRFKFESGVHRVQRIPVTESNGKIQTSTVTVAVLPEADEVDVEINPADLQIDTFRSSGAGGQHINKTESAIRITHIPTGTVVECQDERSQHKNKDKAMKILRSRILEAEIEKQASRIAGERRLQVGTGDRSERIRTYNFPQGRVTDHRIGLTLYKIESIVNGAIDELIDALITADTADRLNAAANEE